MSFEQQPRPHSPLQMANAKAKQVYIQTGNYYITVTVREVVFMILAMKENKKKENTQRTLTHSLKTHTLMCNNFHRIH